MECVLFLGWTLSDYILNELIIIKCTSLLQTPNNGGGKNLRLIFGAATCGGNNLEVSVGYDISVSEYRKIMRRRGWRSVHIWSLWRWIKIIREGECKNHGTLTSIIVIRNVFKLWSNLNLKKKIIWVREREFFFLLWDWLAWGWLTW